MPDESFWLTPGGKIEDSEKPLETVQRELYEETGVIGAEFATPHSYYSEAIYTIAGTQIFFKEHIFIAHTHHTTTNTDNHNEDEKREIVEGRWWDLNEFIASAETFYPRELLVELKKKEGYTVGLVARRGQLLEELQKELQEPSYIKVIDATDVQAREKLTELIQEMSGLDLMVIAISANFANLPRCRPHYKLACMQRSFEQTWKEKERYFNIDAKGFIAMADVALQYFVRQNNGHLVGFKDNNKQFTHYI